MAGQALQPMPSHFRDALMQQLGTPQPMPSHSQLDASQWDKRVNGSQKGNGFLGALVRPDGGVSSEISMSTDDFGGQEFPTVVPTLAPEEVRFLLNMNVGRDKVPSSIISKAVAFARQRQAQGKPLFAQPGEENYAVHPEFKRLQ